ncbi:MAG: response regulator [Cellulosilyticaceae bacterium]
MEKKNILAIDDEEHILELLKYNLETNGFNTFLATSVEEAMPVLMKEKIDAILLDIMLPGIDGVTALKQFRADDNLKYIPIIMVTAKSEEIDKIVGLEVGADDYISKPFSVRELIARVKAVVRRNERVKEEPTVDNEMRLVAEKLEIDVNSHTVNYNGKNIELTYKEFELLRVLMHNKGHVLSRDMLLDKIWGYEYYGETRTVDVHIRYLRAKLDEHGIGEWIQTVRGIGYKFVG